MDIPNQPVRVNLSKQWKLDKMGGNFSSKPKSGTHKLTDVLPLSLILRRKFKRALLYEDVPKIILEKCIKIDNKVRTENKFPVGLMDVISIDKIDTHFRMLYEPKCGRFHLHRIHRDESNYKLCRVNELGVLVGDVPFLITHDGRTFRNPDPDIKKNDTVKVDLMNNEIVDSIAFQNGNLCLITMGSKRGTVGTMISHESLANGTDMVHVEDGNGEQFATRLESVFIIGSVDNLWISLPQPGELVFDPDFWKSKVNDEK